ncbi:MAG: SMC-Scp complex subunit ScpB [Verrucomicrobia bacterium]|nr:SMC-Scp complex subunit ScpB [Verrucomicrobiota bacterium]
MLFASPRPLPAKEIAALLKSAAEHEPENGDCVALGGLKEDEVQTALLALQARLKEEQRGLRAEETTGGWQLTSAPEFGSWVRELFPGERPARLSPAALETLAIVAYRQPITRAEMEAVRGVAVDSIVQTLQERSLIKIVGRAEVPGRPLLYGTTQFFLDHFGIREIAELPNAEELRRVPLKPAAPGTPVAETSPAPAPVEPAAAPTPAAPEPAAPAADAAPAD